MVWLHGFVCVLVERKWVTTLCKLVYYQNVHSTNNLRFKTLPTSTGQQPNSLQKNSQQRESISTMNIAKKVRLTAMYINNTLLKMGSYKGPLHSNTNIQLTNVFV